MRVLAAEALRPYQCHYDPCACDGCAALYAFDALKSTDSPKG